MGFCILSYGNYNRITQYKMTYSDKFIFKFDFWHSIENVLDFEPRNNNHISIRMIPISIIILYIYLTLVCYIIHFCHTLYSHVIYIYWHFLCSFCSKSVNFISTKRCYYKIIGILLLFRLYNRSNFIVLYCKLLNLETVKLL